VPSSRLSVFSLALLVVFSTSGCFLKLFWIDKGGMGERDSAECDTIMAPLRSAFAFPASVNPLVKGEPAAFCGIKGRNFFWPTLFTNIVIYGVVDKPTQDAILASVRTSKRQDFKPIAVTFYEQEIWTVWDPTGSIPSATHEIDKERRLRSAVIR